MTPVNSSTTIEELLNNLEQIGVNVTEIRQANEECELDTEKMRADLTQLLENHVFQMCHRVVIDANPSLS
jgi:hypothetical protein